MPVPILPISDRHLPPYDANRRAIADVAITTGGVATDMQRFQYLSLNRTPRTNIAIGLLCCSAALATFPLVSHSPYGSAEPARQLSLHRHQSATVQGVPVFPVWHCQGSPTKTAVHTESPEPLLSGPNIVRAEQTFFMPGPPGDVYNFLKDMTNYPGTHEDVWDVEALGENRYRWIVGIPGGCWFPYDTTVEARENATIVCRSLPSSPVTFVGRARCRGINANLTKVHVQAAYILPGLAFAEMAAAAVGTSPQEDLELQMQRAFGGLYSKYVTRSLSP